MERADAPILPVEPAADMTPFLRITPVPVRRGALKAMSDAEVEAIFERVINVPFLIDISWDGGKTTHRARVIDASYQEDDVNGVKLLLGDGRIVELPGFVIERILDEYPAEVWGGEK